MNKDKEQEQRHHMKRVMLFNLNEKETSGMECSACSFHLIQQHTNEILFPSLICFLFFFALIQLNYKRKEVESVNLIEIRQSERKQTGNRIHIVGGVCFLVSFHFIQFVLPSLILRSSITTELNERTRKKHTS